MDQGKIAAARKALNYIDDDMIIGVGTGRTVQAFIEALGSVKGKIEAAVASSIDTENRLRAIGIPIIDLNAAKEIPFYFDSADEINAAKQMIKGGGGALTREKIIASASKKFVCMVDEKKCVEHFKDFPVAIEVIPIARSFVAREIVRLGGDPMYRQGFVTDNGNVILDVYNFDLLEPAHLEGALKKITGVVESGIFAHRKADFVLIGDVQGNVKVI